MKPIDVRNNTYIDFDKEVNDKNSKFPVDDNVKILKNKNIFVIWYTSNWSEEAFLIFKIKNAVPCTYIISDLKVFGTLYDKEMHKTN